MTRKLKIWDDYNYPTKMEGNTLYYIDCVCRKRTALNVISGEPFKLEGDVQEFGGIYVRNYQGMDNPLPSEIKEKLIKENNEKIEIVM